jgi:hypothetical protein
MLNVNVEVGLIIKKIVNIMNKIKLYLELYYPIILSFLSFLYSVSLWFSGYKLEGIFVGIWVPSILAFAICIRQRRNDFFKQLAYKNRRKVNTRKKRR